MFMEEQLEGLQCMMGIAREASDTASNPYATDGVTDRFYTCSLMLRV